MDLTSKLPDEILIEVLARLPSLRDKLRVECVSHRFQRCLVKLLNTKPQPLEWIGENGHLNGYKVPELNLEQAVLMLAKKARIDRILIDFASKNEVEGILRALAISSSDSLDKVAAFHLRCRRLPHFVRYLLAPVLAKCPKLTTLKLDLYVCHLKSKEKYLFRCQMDLVAAIAGHALTQLNICLEGHTQQQIVQLYQSLKPKTLTKIQLYLRDTTLETVDAFVNDLAGAWMAMEEIELDLLRVELQMAQLFPSLARLPKLRKCHITMCEINAENQLVDVLNALLASGIQMTLLNGSIQGDGDLDLELGNYEIVRSGCETVALIRQVQAVHPEIQVGFGTDGRRLTLTLGKVSFEHFSSSNFRWTRPCQNGHCAECGIFYPTVIRQLLTSAWRRMHGMQDDHLANCRVDRCRTKQTVADLNAMAQFARADRWLTAVSAELNEDENLVTVTFIAVRPVLENIQDEQVQITVDCGHCISFGCPGCLQI